MPWLRTFASAPGGAASKRAAMSGGMMEQMSEIMLGLSKLYVVELMHYTLACMMILEDFPEGKGTRQTLSMQKSSWVGSVNGQLVEIEFVVRVRMLGIGFSTSQGTSTFSRRHPLSSWIGSMLLCFAGEIFTAGLIGESLLSYLTTCPANCLLSATVVWSASQSLWTCLRF